MRQPPFLRCVCCLALCLAACRPDLPDGWEGAERFELQQGPCDGNPYDGSTPETVHFNPRPGGLDMVYSGAHFRCAQDVEGFLRSDGYRYDLLVQPKDMDPSVVAGCDCLYEITAALELPAGEHAVDLYRRWDNLNDPNPLVLVGGTLASIR